MNNERIYCINETESNIDNMAVIDVKINKYGNIRFICYYDKNFIDTMNDIRVKYFTSILKQYIYESGINDLFFGDANTMAILKQKIDKLRDNVLIDILIDDIDIV